MKRHLFLTGPIGCGKSTAIAGALGDKLSSAGGFLTRRHREDGLSFTLESPDGRQAATFLDFPEGKPRVDLEVFARRGIPLLSGKFLVLDEIGGVELLCPAFMAALEKVLESDVPILGVIKGQAPASTLIRALGLAQDYEEAACHLRARLEADGDSLVYECSQFDPQAKILAECWVKEYVHE